jgi:hypothetical protein
MENTTKRYNPFLIFKKGARNTKPLFSFSLTQRYYINIFLLIFITSTPVVLLLLPADFFDHGRSMCLSVLLFNRQCPACGMTRACMHLIHRDFEDAYAYNMMSFIVMPLLCIVWVQWFIKEFKLNKFLRKKMAEKNLQQS